MNGVGGSTSSSGSGTISSLGVGSGLDVNGIINKLMSVQNQPIMLLEQQQVDAQTTVSAFGTLKSALSQFQTSLQSLNDISTYQSVNATTGNSALATVTATSAAVPGTYSLQVNQLAQTQNLVAAGQASNTSPIGVGTISFSFGTTTGTVADGKFGAGTTFTSAGAAAQTVTISNSNNSLTGIAAAINSANIGVKASILNDGSGTPYRLSLTSTSTGAANSMQISVNGDPALANLLNQDPTSTTGQNLVQTSAAQNAQFTLNGLPISSNTNTNSAVLPGVTLNLLSANATAPTTLTVTQSTGGAVTAINSFVSAYNKIASTIAQATAYNANSKQAGPLQGQNSVLSIYTQMQSILDQAVPGAPAALSMLGQVGVSFQSDGTLKVDSTRLQSVLATNPSGVASLFSSNGSVSDSLISYTGSTSATQPGAYAVNITQNATMGSTVGSAAAATTITSGVNDTLKINLNGVTTNVTLAAGTYTSDSLASALQTAINTNNAFSSAGSTVTVSQTGGVLTLTSSAYGSASIASITGGNGLAPLFGSSPVAVNGQDVAGSIDGQPATGKGQTLKGASGGATGMSILINGGPIGGRGVVHFTQGYVNELSNLMTTVLGKSGQIAAAANGLNSTIESFQKSINSQKKLNQQVLDGLKAQYSALDITMSKLQSTTTFLNQQLASLSASLSPGR